MVKNNYLLVILTCLFLSACGGGGGGSSHATVYDPVPSLVGFDIIDSYGVNTATSSTPLEIDPFVDNGLFDVYWRVNSLEDYEVNIRVNSAPDPYKSTLVYSEVCGEGLGCDQGGNVICEYTPDFIMSCGGGPDTSVRHLPQNSYMILEICDLDSSYCSYKYYPVSLL